MKQVIAIFLCLIFIFLFACQPKDTDNSNNSGQEAGQEIPKLIEKELTTTNFYNYITIQIKQIDQQTTHIRDNIIQGVTIKHYSILTTFSVTSTPNNQSYIFENSYFAYKICFDSKTNSNIYARIYINQDGSGYNTFTIIEYDTTIPYIYYRFQTYFGKPNSDIKDYDLKFTGKVKYYE